MTGPLDDEAPTKSRRYFDYLVRRRYPFDVQRPYRWNLQRRKLGVTLDVGCGIGRNLRALEIGSVGIDHNEYAVAECRRRGLLAFTVEKFSRNNRIRFQSLLFAHVLEHATFEDACVLVREKLKYLQPKGRVVIITPQAAGQRSDPTHITFFDRILHRKLCRALDLTIEVEDSFPFPSFVGRVFKHNETITVARLP